MFSEYRDETANFDTVLSFRRGIENVLARVSEKPVGRFEKGTKGGEMVSKGCWGVSLRVVSLHEVHAGGVSLD